MPTFAKVLAFLNVLAAGLFVYLAGIDIAQRLTWARAAFIHELVLDGLPVEERDTGPRRAERPLVADLGDDDSSLLADLFKLAGKDAKPAVKTQDREVERARAETMKEINDIEDAAKQRMRIKELMFAQARTFDEREEMAQKFADKNQTNDNLKKLLEDRFEDCLLDVSLPDDRTGTDRNLLAKRRLIAHLLYNLSADLAKHQRVMIVVGLNTYVEEADRQALELQKMVARTRSAALTERIAFEADFLRQRDRIVALSQAVERQEVALTSLKELRERQEKEIINPLKERKAELEKELVKAKEETADVLARQDDLETRLFGLHRQIGDLLTENQKLEREIRLMELGPVRGVQR